MAGTEGTRAGSTLAEALPPRSVAVREQAADREAAIRRCGELLTASGRVTADYTDEMLAAVEEFGPYIVIAPGLALAHSRPSAAVRDVAFSVLTLEPPIEFGHADHDPVQLVVGLAAPDDESHIEALREMADLLSDDERRDRLMGASTVEEVMALIQEGIKEG
jgi:ascorbate PTS system EIIA or EIIAB component